MAPKTRAKVSNKKQKKPAPKAANIESEIESENESDSDELSSNLKKLKKQFREQRKTITQLTESFDFMGGSFEQVKSQLTKISNENKKMRKEIDRLTENENTMKKRIDQLEMDLARDKQKSNENHVIITNIPKVEMDLRDAIVAIGKQVGCRIDKNGIIITYQSENKKYHTHPIIVKLKSGDFKRKCVEYRKQGNKIDVSQIVKDANMEEKNVNFHPLLEKELSDLLKHAKTAARKKPYKFVWVSESTVLAGKMDNTQIIKIKSTEDLKKIK